MTQSKLSLGFRMDTQRGERVLFQLMNAVLGGTASSKLFQNVREKESLCYYCSSGFSWSSCSLTIDSGVDTVNMDRTEEAIFQQIEAMQRGEVTEEELLYAKLALKNSMGSLQDSLHSVENWYLGPHLRPARADPGTGGGAAHVLHRGRRGGGRPQAGARGGLPPEGRGVLRWNWNACPAAAWGIFTTTAVIPPGWRFSSTPRSGAAPLTPYSAPGTARWTTASSAATRRRRSRCRKASPTIWSTSSSRARTGTPLPGTPAPGPAPTPTPPSRPPAISSPAPTTSTSLWRSCWTLYSLPTLQRRPWPKSRGLSARRSKCTTTTPSGR